MSAIRTAVLCLLLYHRGTCSEERSLDDPSLWQEAISYATNLGMDEGVLQRLEEGETTTLHQIGKHKLQNDAEIASGLEMLHALADSSVQPHIGSQVSLGMHYYHSVGDKVKALHYFAQAGEDGPHQAALYNAGRIYSELGEWIPALAFVQAAATLGESYPQEVSDTLTETCRSAFEIMMQQLSRQSLGIQQSADIFMYANLQDFPPAGSNEAGLWYQAVVSLDSFNRTFAESDGQQQDQESMLSAFQSMHNLWQTSSAKLSSLQSFLLLQHTNDMLGFLCGFDSAYLPTAADYAEALAMSPYCYGWAASSEEEQSCFNEAAVASVAYHRQIGDLEGALRVMEMGRSHPIASTHWETLEQTPRVYHHGLISKPWWKADDFPTAVTLKRFYKSNRNTIIEELRKIEHLKEGLFPSGHVEITTDGSTEAVVDFGFRRISTPYIGLQTDDEATRSEGAGGWSEFGPLFDRGGWKDDMCSWTPTLCEAIKQEQSSLCIHGAPPEYVETILQAYGTDTLVTLLRLRPGTRIQPHNGTTNRRLIMHWCLEGCDGIQFTVGGTMVENYDGGDGSVIVFDDSFEHSVYHAGTRDRFVLVAVFAHPDTRNEAV